MKEIKDRNTQTDGANDLLTERTTGRKTVRPTMTEKSGRIFFCHLFCCGFIPTFREVLEQHAHASKEEICMSLQMHYNASAGTSFQ